MERVNCIDAENVKIMGKGVLVTSGKRAITFKNCNNMLIQDIVQLHTPEHGWSANLEHSNHLRIVNFKVLGAKDYSTDGTNLMNYTNVRFSNITIDGKRMASNDNPCFDVNQHVENVTVVRP